MESISCSSAADSFTAPVQTWLHARSNSARCPSSSLRGVSRTSTHNGIGYKMMSSTRRTGSQKLEVLEAGDKLRWAMLDKQMEIRRSTGQLRT
eukprot:Skav213200  [mRNA]  locus=scaffold2826:374456:375071:- [translate_table: standard]